MSPPPSTLVVVVAVATSSVLVHTCNLVVVMVVVIGGRGGGGSRTSRRAPMMDLIDFMHSMHVSGFAEGNVAVDSSGDLVRQFRKSKGSTKNKRALAFRLPAGAVPLLPGHMRASCMLAQ